MLKPDIDYQSKVSDFQPMPEEYKPDKVTVAHKLIHGLNIPWQWAKGKKRRASIVLLTAGNIALLAGNPPLGGALLGVGTLLSTADAVQKVGEKLNEKTSGPKINWAELIEKFIELLKMLVARPKI